MKIIFADLNKEWLNIDNQEIKNDLGDYDLGMYQNE